MLETLILAFLVLLFAFALVFGALGVREMLRVRGIPDPLYLRVPYADEGPIEEDGTLFTAAPIELREIRRDGTISRTVAIGSDGAPRFRLGPPAPGPVADLIRNLTFNELKGRRGWSRDAVQISAAAFEAAWAVAEDATNPLITITPPYRGFRRWRAEAVRWWVEREARRRSASDPRSRDGPRT